MDHKPITDKTTELVVLSFMLKSRATSVDVVCKITEDHFQVPLYKDIYNAIIFLYSSIDSIDKFTLMHRLVETSKLAAEIKVNQLEIVIDSLFNTTSVISTESLDFYLNKLDDIYQKRTFIKYLEDEVEYVKKTISDNNVDVYQCVTRVESKLINKLTRKAPDEPEDIFSNLQQFAEELFENQQDIVGLRTGFNVLDERIDGLEKGTLTVIAAPKKTGKSTVCMNIALNVAIESELPVLYIDTEMSSTKNKTRILANITGIPEKRLKRGKITDAERKTVKKVLTKLDNKVQFFHKYVPGFTLESVLALIRSYHIKHNIGLAIFDYIKTGSSDSFVNLKEHQILGNMAIGLKDLAGVLEIPILTAVQVGRSGDIADSDRIARYADTIVFFSPRTKDEIDELGFDYGMYKFIVKHARSGGTTDESGIGVHFRRPTLTITEADKQTCVDEDVEDSRYEQPTQTQAEEPVQEGTSSSGVDMWME